MIFYYRMIEMKANELKLDELVDFSDGGLSLQGRRLILHDMHAFAQFRKDLIEMTGLDYARRILTRFGYFEGQADAAAMQRIYKWDTIEEWLKAGARMQTLQGVARTVVNSIKCDQAAGSLEMEIAWHNSAEAEEHMVALGKVGFPVCWILAGYLSGYASYCLGKDVFFIESQCRAWNDSAVCLAVGRNRAAWDERSSRELEYFKPEEIHGKVTFLTNELRRKTKELSRQRRELDRLTHAASPAMIEVHSEAFRRVIILAERVALFDTSLLITGETGVGKEVLARHIHDSSPRAGSLFLGVNCGALPETLLESELFGHRAGSFTGAARDRTGLFEQAGNGTIFLDEIGEVSPAVQVKLLRVLQEHEITRLGESRPRKISARIVAATNRNLESDVREGRFREDLFYRLRVIEIHIPPLRERRDDILPLARYFVLKTGRKLKIKKLRLDPRCMDLLLQYRWPGNIRELENAVEHAAVLSNGPVIFPELLPSHIIHAAETMIAPGAGKAGRALALADVEGEHIRRVLESTQGHRGKAAALLGISPSTLWRKMKQSGNQ